MSSRTLLTLIAGGRVVIGLAMLVAPKLVGERWLGRGGADVESATLMRVAGIRDTAFGVGALVAARNGSDPRPWHAASAVIDGTDACATATAEGVPGPNKAGAIAVAGGAALAALAAIILGDD